MTQPLGTPADPINPQHYQGFSNGAEVIDITENLTFKVCPKCDNDRPLSDWNRNKKRYDGLASWCKHCLSDYNKEWRARPEVKERQAKLAAERYAAMSPEEKRQYSLGGTLQRRKTGYSLKSKYGLSIEQYDSILESQGGGCAICGKKPQGHRRMPVDHDHACCPGKKTCGECIRGILCVTCNVWLGFYENKMWIDRAKSYLSAELAFGSPDDDAPTAERAKRGGVVDE